MTLLSMIKGPAGCAPAPKADPPCGDYASGPGWVGDGEPVVDLAAALGVCWLDDEGHVRCTPESGGSEWDDYGQLEPPDTVQFQSISASPFRTCGVTVAGDVVCWGYDFATESEGLVQYEGPFVEVETGGWMTCATDEDGGLTCWDAGLREYASAEGYTWRGYPEEKLHSISVSALYGCGLSEASEIVCWGADAEGETQPPGGQFASISASDDYACGLRDGGVPECWGGVGLGIDAPPPYRALDVAGFGACAITEDECVACDTTFFSATDTGHYGVVGQEPSGTFTGVVLGVDYGCATTAERSARCFGKWQPVP